MELIDPLKGAALRKPVQATAGLIDPLNKAVGKATAVANYELGNMDVCPDCSQPMEQLVANDILSNVCMKHRVCLPVKDKAPE